jgi:translin
MLNRKDFLGMKKELDKTNEISEALYRDSRDLVGLTKKIIFALHRGDKNEAGRLMPAMEKIKKRMQATVKGNNNLRHNASYAIAMQEYVEAAGYYSFIKSGRIPAKAQFGVSTEEYLSGLCDLTGELVRKAVDLAIKGNSGEVERIREFLKEFYGLLLEVNPYGELRKKADQARWNLNKLEDVVYDNKLRQK